MHSRRGCFNRISDTQGLACVIIFPNWLLFRAAIWSGIRFCNSEFHICQSFSSRLCSGSRGYETFFFFIVHFSEWSLHKLLSFFLDFNSAYETLKENRPVHGDKDQDKESRGIVLFCAELLSQLDLGYGIPLDRSHSDMGHNLVGLISKLIRSTDKDNQKNAIQVD